MPIPAFIKIALCKVIQNQGFSSYGIRNCRALMSRIQHEEFRIPLTIGIRNPRFHDKGSNTAIRNPQHEIQPIQDFLKVMLHETIFSASWIVSPPHPSKVVNDFPAKALNIVATLFLLWFNFILGLNFIFFCFWVW